MTAQKPLRVGQELASCPRRSSALTTENQSRLTLGELLLTTAIVAALASLLLPVSAQDRERVGRAASAPRYRSNERILIPWMEWLDGW